ncbi:MAG: SH3 domain-containing protein [Bacteroidetes bacterium]|nr:SH3 domain-containing protein [Bacteroidota bacterium]
MFKYHLVFIIFVSLLLTGNCYGKMMSVTGNKVNLRSGPGLNYSVKWEYGSGYPLKVRTEKGKWVKVEDFERDTGWVFKSLLEKKPHMIVRVNKNKDKKINIRTGPGTNYKVVGKAYYGVVFETIEQKKGWAKVKHESGLVGWIKRSLLWGY